MTAPPATTVHGRDLAALWLLAFLASAIVGTHGLLYWDAGDYVRLALEGGTSGLALGRPLFLFISRMILATGVDPLHAEPVLRWFWTVVGSAAAPGLALLGSRLGLGRPVCLVAGAMLALSPSFAHTTHQVLTDAPALTLSIAALIAAAGSRAILSGLLLGAAIATRETAAIHAIAIVLLLGRRSVAAMGVMAVTLATIMWMFPPSSIASWATNLATPSAMQWAGAVGFFKSMAWVVVAGPVPVLVGAWALSRRPSGRWLVVSIPALVGTIALLFYPEGWFSPRYVLATAPLAFFFAAAEWLVARFKTAGVDFLAPGGARKSTPAVLIVSLLVPLSIVPFATKSARAMEERGAQVMRRVPLLPEHSVVVAGHYCPEAQLAARIHNRDDLNVVCPGWGWPADPAAVLDAAIAAGRPVAIEMDPAAWLKGEAKNRAVINAWATAHQGRQLAGFLVIH